MLYVSYMAYLYQDIFGSVKYVWVIMLLTQETSSCVNPSWVVRNTVHLEIFTMLNYVQKALF